MNDLSQAEMEAISKAMNQDPADISATFENESISNERSTPTIASHAEFLPLEEKNSRDPTHEEMEQLKQVSVQLEVLLGNTLLSISELLKLHEGSVISLNQLATEPVIIRAGGKTIAKGEVVLVRDQLGVKLTDIESLD